MSAYIRQSVFPFETSSDIRTYIAIGGIGFENEVQKA